ncbi:VOC family protein [Phycicoccus flavus]|uniref:VOC family protein n=1 Tax=Phycicoccus flavus TaxID=2502783 RepID=UPI000FEB5F28|nr:VOC family protein [Phycicoccus flavus]NHA67336.1 VOC family protein [Phycicoccus flavus]
MDRSHAPVQVVIDCADPASLVSFWAEALAPRGYAVPAPPGGFADWPAFLLAQGVPGERWNDASALEAEGQPRIFLQRVDEPKTGKNRVHVDLLGGGGPSVPLDTQRERVAAEVARLEALGATRLAEHTDLGVHWVTMQDPEGNEFCV